MSVTKQLQSRTAQLESAWNNLDRSGIKSFYSKNYQAYYADQSEAGQDLMDEIGVSVMDYELIEALIDLSVDIYRYSQDELGISIKFEYRDFRLINIFDEITQTSHLVIMTLSSDDETVMLETRGLISWEKQGNSWKIISESSLK